MEDADEVAQEPVGTEGRFFIEVAAFDVAAVSLMLSEGAELVVAVVLASEFLIGDVVVATIAEEPYVSFTASLEDGFKGQRY